VIPGEILRGELLREPPGPLRMEIEPDSQAPDKHGYLKVWDRLRERRIPLSGGAWSVLKTIFDEPARIISLDELCKKTHLTTPNAVRSAIQRLIGDARASGVENILDNLYGKGYRKGESPNWSQLT
jgi:DNA-binding response OmpR family regulator